jgi:trehalose 6-phosphate phosphatase
MADPAQDWALFVDFDGTLVDIAEAPDAVVVEPGLAETLALLRTALGGALAIVSGRPVAVLDGFLGEGFDAAGLHGLEVRIAGRLEPCRPEDHPKLRRGIAWLRETLDGKAGVLVEDKGCSVGVHWRMAPDHAALAKETAEELAAELGPEYRIQHGKMVAEVLPATAGKGGAVARFLSEAPYRGRRPLFVGDDLTDEDGFSVANARGGASVRIGTGPTSARHRFPAPAAFREALKRWAERGAVDLPPSS